MTQYGRKGLSQHSEQSSTVSNFGGGGVPAVGNDVVSIVGGGRTTQIISITDIISEGEIEGLVNGGAGIIIDGNPMFAEGEAPSNSAIGNGVTGATNTTSVTTLAALDSSILSDIGDNFLLVKNATNVQVEVSNVGAIRSTTNGSTQGFTATLTASSSIFTSAMVHDPQTLNIISDAQLADGDVTIKLILSNGEHIFGYISAFTSATVVTFKSNTSANMEDYTTSTEFNAGNSHKIFINLVLKIASISGTTITVTSNPAIAFSNKEFTITEPYNPSVGQGSPQQTTNASYQIRHGTLTQTPMRYLKGVGSSSVTLSPSTDNLTRGVGRVISTTGLSGAQKSEVDSVSVLISYPAGLYFMNEESGNTDRPCGAGYRFEVGIDQGSGLVYRNAGGNLAPGDYHAASVANNGSERLVGHQGIFKSAVIFEHSIDLTPFQPFQDFAIRITRVTNHGTVDDGVNFETAHFGIIGQGVGGALKSLGNEKYKGFMLSKIHAATGIIKEKLNYPFTAMANIEYNSKQFQGMPKRAYHMQGIKVKLPSNYTTRKENASTGLATYTGAWDGTFRAEKVYTDNPAWIFYDILTNNRFGLGDWLASGNDFLVDKYSLYRIGKYCDELVPDGKGGTEPRFTANLYLTKATDAYKVIKDMATIFRSMLYWLNGEVVPVIDEKKFPVYNFSKSNVIGPFQYEGTGHKTRANQYVVKWNNPDTGYKLEPLIVEDRLDIIKKGRIITKSAVAFGCTSEGQAIRYGRWKLWTGLNQTEIVNFKTGLNAAFLVPGDIINIQDADEFDIAFSGRLNSYTESGGNKLTLDRDIDIHLPTSGYTYQISIIVPKKVAILNQDSATVNTVALTRGDPVPTARTANGGGQVTLIHATDDDTTKLNVGNALDDSDNSLTLILRESTIVQERTLTGTSTINGVSTAVPAAAVDGRTTVQVTETLDEVQISDLPNAIWAIKQIGTATSTATASSAKQYKILAIGENDDSTYDISAAVHYNAKFDSIETDFGLAVEDPLFPPEPNTSPPAPASCYILRTPNRFKEGEEVVLQWEPPSNYAYLKGFEVTHNFTENQLQVIEEVASNVTRMSFNELNDGTYYASIRTITERGKKSKPTETFVELTDIFEGERIQGIRKGGATTAPINLASSSVYFTAETYKIGPLSNNPHGTNQELRKQNDSSNAGSISQSIATLSSGSWAGQKNGNANYAYVFYDYSNTSHGSNDPMKLITWKIDGDLGVNYWYDADKYAANAASIWTNLSGTVSIAEGSNKVVGSSTSFTSLDVTRVLKFSNTFGASIAFIESDTVLFLDRPATAAISAGTTAQVDELGIDYRTDFLLGLATHESSYDFESYMSLTQDVALTPKSMIITCNIPELSYSSGNALLSTFDDIKLKIVPIGFDTPEVKVFAGASSDGFSQLNQSAETSFTAATNGIREATLHSVANDESPAITFTGGALEFRVEVREKNNTSVTKTEAFTLTKVKAAAIDDTAVGFSAQISNQDHTFYQTSAGVVNNDFAASFTVVSGGTTYSYAASGTTNNTFGITIGNAAGGIQTSEVSVSGAGQITITSAANILDTATVKSASFTATLNDLGNSNALIGVFTITLNKVTMAQRDGVTKTITSLSSAQATAYKGTLTDVVAQAVAAAVIASDIVPDGTDHVKRIVPNDRITVKSGNIVATRIFTGNAEATSGNVTASDFSSVVAAEFDGSVIVDGTLSAAKITADSTTTGQLNIGNKMVLASGGSFHTPNKTAFTDNDNGFFLDTDGNFYLGDTTNHLKYTASSGALSLAGNFSLAGPQGIQGIQGPQGNSVTGEAARTVVLTASKYTIVYATDGTTESDTITFTAAPQNTSGTLTYQFLVDGVEKQAFGSSTTYTMADADEPAVNTSKLVTVNMKEDGVQKATDAVSVYGIKSGTDGDDGQDAVTIIVTNETHTVPTASDGTSPDFTGSGTKIDVFVGATQCSFNTTGPNTFAVSIQGYTNAGSTGSTSTENSNKTFVAPDLTSLDDDTATRTFTISVRNAAENSLGTFTKVQTFSRAKAGVSGTTTTVTQQVGKAYVYVRGDGFTSPNASGALSAINATTGRDSPVEDDFVILTDTSNADDTTNQTVWRYTGTGTTWEAVSAHISGSILVDGTVAADKVKANAITASKLAISLTPNADNSLPANSSGIFMDATNNVIEILESGVTRVKIGNLS